MEIKTSADTSLNIQLVKPTIDNVEQPSEIMITICDETHKKPVFLDTSLSLSQAIALVSELTGLIESALTDKMAGLIKSAL